MIELVTVIVILGILAVTALPTLSSSSAFQALSFHDEVVAALRYAQKTAVSHRRLVCATLTASTVSLQIAASNGATGCTTTLPGPDGGAFAQSVAPNTIQLTASPSAVLFFQSSGLVTGAATNGSATNFSVQVTGQPVINVWGETGYVN